MGIISCGTTLIDQGLYQGLSSVDWDTTPKTATFTGVAGNGYFCNTSSGTFTLNLPAGSVGDIIAVSDYASTFNVAEISAVYSNPESTLGTADLTVSTVSNFSAPSGTVRAQDLYSAVDVGSFTSSDYGVLWETGGTGEGFAASLEAGGQLWVAAYDGDPWANSAMAYLKVDVSSYYNTPGTFYTTIDVSSKQFNLYFQPGGPTSGNQAISLGTSTAGTTTSWAGTAAGALGQLNSGMVNFGFTNYNQTFTGDAQELRWYYNTAEPSPFQSITTPAVSGTPLTISPNGTDKINGKNDDYTATTKGVSLVLLYIDSTRGWKVIGGGEIDSTGSSFITATGGTVTTCGNYKTHVFTGPGTFCVSAGSGDCAVAEYLVVAGGGGGGDGAGPPYNFKQFGGGAAGGFRIFYSCGTANPLSGPAAIPISVQAYPITVGSGGAGAPTSGVGTDGSNSIFSTITSTGGGAGQTELTAGNTGGSGAGGGGSDGSRLGGTGNTPPVSPSQGNDGGGGSGSSGASDNGGGGGGGAGAVGGGGGPVYGTSSLGGLGGDGSYVSDVFFGPPAPSYGEGGPVSSTRYFAGGAGGGNHTLYGPQAVRPGGVGGGGDGGPSPTAGSTNMGGGGGGGKAGGSGIVVIRYKFQ